VSALRAPGIRCDLVLGNHLRFLLQFESNVEFSDLFMRCFRFLHVRACLYFIDRRAFTRVYLGHALYEVQKGHLDLILMSILQVIRV